MQASQTLACLRLGKKNRVRTGTGRVQGASQRESGYRQVYGASISRQPRLYQGGVRIGATRPRTRHGVSKRTSKSIRGIPRSKGPVTTHCASRLERPRCSLQGPSSVGLSKPPRGGCALEDGRRVDLLAEGGAADWPGGLSAWSVLSAWLR